MRSHGLVLLLLVVLGPGLVSGWWPQPDSTSNNKTGGDGDPFVNRTFFEVLFLKLSALFNTSFAALPWLWHGPGLLRCVPLFRSGHRRRRCVS